MCCVDGRRVPFPSGNGTTLVPVFVSGAVVSLGSPWGRMGGWFIACRFLAGKELYDGWRGIMYKAAAYHYNSTVGAQGKG